MSFDLQLMRPAPGGDVLVYTLQPDINASQSKEIMGDNKISFTLDTSSMAYFRVGDYMDVYGERYYVYSLPVTNKASSREYEYTVVMYADYKRLENCQYKFYNADNELRETDFTLMGDPDTFIDLVIANINGISDGWTKGEVIPGIFKNLSFSGENLLEVLGRLATEYDTEYKIEGRRIHLAKRGRNTGITLRNGYDRGLYSIRRENVDDSGIVTRLYARGSDQNLPGDYRNYSTRLKMTGGIDYLEKNVDKYGVIEATQIFNDIFPHRTGTITGVNNLNFFQFTDGTMDFDINDFKLPGINIKMTFNTGQLAGYTFDISNYNALTKTFTVNKNKDEKKIDVPSSDFRAAIGDQYVLVDLQMPQAYIDAAEADLTAQAQALLDTASEPALKYTVVTDPEYMRKNRVVLDAGDRIWIVDAELEVNRAIRINQLTRAFADEYDYNVTLSDTSSTGYVDGVNSSIASNSRGISSISSQIDNSRQSENNFVGNVIIDQGTLNIDDLQPLPSGMGSSPVVIGTDGNLYRG